jgi:CTP:molybdopterin cytidylyltransferase MocA
MLLLAGGKSSRMGTPKGLLSWEGQSLIQAHCQRFLEVGGSFVLVVLGFYAREYLDQLEWLNKGASLARLKVSYCLNPNPNHGQFSSVIEGLIRIKAMTKNSSSPVFVQPVDMPPPTEEVLVRLADSLGPSHKVSLPVYDAKIGHPVLLSACFQEKLLGLALPKQHRLDHQIANLGDDDISYVAVNDKNVTLNFNEPTDLARQSIQPEILEI